MSGEPGGGMARPASKLNPDLGAVVQLAGLDAGVSPILAGSAGTADAIERLKAAGEWDAAARLGAFALPRREAVWWAIMCCIHTAPEDQPEAELQVRAAAERWVRNPEDATRRLAMDLARRAGFSTAESWAAVAAFWSEGSMSPADQPAVPPPPHLAGTAVAGAVSLAALRRDPGRREERLQRFLGSLDAIAAGGGGRIPPEMTGP